MATSAVLCATQDMLRLLTTSSGGEGGDAMDISQTALAALCVPGPLKSMLAAPLFEGAPGPGAASWVTLNADARLSVTQAGYGASPSTTVNSYRFMVASAINVLHLTVDGTADTTMITELQFNVTNGR